LYSTVVQLPISLIEGGILTRLDAAVSGCIWVQETDDLRIVNKAAVGDGGS